MQLHVTELAAFASRQRPLLLDVREPWELALARIELHDTPTLALPLRDVPSRCDEIDRDRCVVCICHHGARSAQVVAFLLRQGYDRVYNLAGGIDAWSGQVDPRVPRY